MPADVINLPVISDELEDNYAGATERLLTVHFGVPDPPVDDAPDDSIFRWEQPVDGYDAAGGFIGGPDGFWHPRRLKGNSFRGPTSPYFIRADRGPIPPDITEGGDD